MEWVGEGMGGGGSGGVSGEGSGGDVTCGHPPCRP